MFLLIMDCRMMHIFTSRAFQAYTIYRYVLFTNNKQVLAEPAEILKCHLLETRLQHAIVFTQHQNEGHFLWSSCLQYRSQFGLLWDVESDSDSSQQLGFKLTFYVQVSLISLMNTFLIFQNTGCPNPVTIIRCD